MNLYTWRGTDIDSDESCFSEEGDSSVEVSSSGGGGEERMDDEQDTDSDVGIGFSSSGGDGNERNDAVGSEKRIAWWNQSLSISSILHRKFLFAISFVCVRERQRMIFLTLGGWRE